MKSRFSSFARYCFSLVLFYSIVRLYLNFLPSFLSHWGFDLLLLSTIPFWLIYTREQFNGHIKEISLLTFLLAFILVLSVVFSEYKLNAVLNLVKIVLYALYIVFFISLTKKFDFNASFLIKILDWAFVVVFLVAIFQLLDPPLIGDLVKVLYDDKFLRSIWTGNPRVFSTFNNANFFGVYLSFMLAIWLNYFLHFKKSFRWLLVRLLPLALMIIVSGSRTGMAASAIVMIMSLTIQRYTIREILKYIMGFLVFLIATIALLWLFTDSLGNTINRFNVFLAIATGETYTDDSVSGRLDRQLLAINYLVEKPLFGYGHRPNDLAPHNAYLTILLCFGVIGFVGLLLWVIFLSMRIISQASLSSDGLYFKKCFLVFSIALAVAMLAGDFIFTSQVMFLWILLVAVSLSSNTHRLQPVVVLKKVMVNKPV